MRELAAQQKFSGTIFSSMFTLCYTPPFKLPSGKQLVCEPTVTGYFSQDPRKLLLDYSFSKKAKLFSLIQMLVLPLLPLLIFAIATRRHAPHPLVYLVFYCLCFLLDAVFSYLFFRLCLAKIHKIIALQALY